MLPSSVATLIILNTSTLHSEHPSMHGTIRHVLTHLNDCAFCDNTKLRIGGAIGVFLDPQNLQTEGTLQLGMRDMCFCSCAGLQRSAQAQSRHSGTC